MPIQTDLALLKRRRTKVVATLGPASSSPLVLAELVGAGVDVFRLNMSHGDHAGHAANYAAVRAAAEAAGRHVAVLADLCGPKIRCGRFAGGSIELEAGRPVTVTVRDVEGGPGLIPSQYAALAGDVEPGDRILLDDGNLELRVEGVAGTEVACRVVHGGRLSDRKGINLPGVAVSAPSLTDKDRRDAAFALGLGVDLLALSFVRRAADVHELRALIDATGKRCAIVAKIEKPEALAEYESILDACEAVMVARGDLGVELNPEQVPVVQDLLVDRARARHRPVIVATQMLESMIEHARPTRAEVSDVSHAVASGADAVMLSAESASGRHPLLAVRMMDRIARQTEAYLWQQGAFGSIADARSAADGALPVVDAVARSTAHLSRDLRVRAIVVVSRNGTSASVVSSARPAAPVVSVSALEQTCRWMSLLWGIVPVLVPEARLADPQALARDTARALELADPGDRILLVQGFNEDPARATPSVTVLGT
jgi:pyruvate kinase